MPLKKRKIELVDIDTGQVVDVFESLRACALETNMPLVKVHKICNGKSSKPKYYPRYQEDEPVFRVDTTRAWYCKEHKVWIRKGQPCPLCNVKKR